MTQGPEPTLADVLEARRRISPHLRPTPLFGYAALNDLLDANVFVKHENHQPIGAFKVRGGVNLVSQLSPEERERGVITASTGNHGQSIAYAARLFGVAATICVPEQANRSRSPPCACGVRKVWSPRLGRPSVLVDQPA